MIHSKVGFTRIDDTLTCDGVSLAQIVSEYETPLYVYSLRAIESQFDRLANAFGVSGEPGVSTTPLIAYATKANSNLAILRALANRGSGFDIVSVGELTRLSEIDADPKTILFSGVGKRPDEITSAIEYGVLAFNLESLAEAELMNDIGRDLNAAVPVAIRINPELDVQTAHEYIATGRKENKFGLNHGAAETLMERLSNLAHLRPIGLHAHIGSQILDPEIHANAARVLESFAAQFTERGFDLQLLNIGGGFGIDYEKGESHLEVEKVAEKVLPFAKRLKARLVIEPGRFIAGPSGALLTKALSIKHGSVKSFVIVDAAMTDLLRPSLYNATHRIVPVKTVGAPNASDQEEKVFDVVGPVCETGDFLGRDCRLPANLQTGDLLAVLDAGAYGMVMTSNYNTRPRPAEVLIHEGESHIIREREMLEDLLSFDEIPEFLW